MGCLLWGLLSFHGSSGARLAPQGHLGVSEGDREGAWASLLGLTLVFGLSFLT